MTQERTFTRRAATPAQQRAGAAPFAGDWIERRSGTDRRAPEDHETATYPILDPDAPCGWCGSVDRRRIQRGPSPLGWQCADADACNRARGEERAREQRGGQS